MAMHKVPTLVLGIGGIGCRIAANISDLLTPEARERVGIVGIDTNINDLSKVAVRGVRTIQTSDDRTVGEYLKRNPQHLPWFPLNAFTASKSLLNGAGQIRAVSRLGALASKAAGKFSVIDDAIDTAGLPLIGVIPEDSDVPAALNRGVALRDFNFYAARAYENIARRLTGEKVPLMRI